MLSILFGLGFMALGAWGLIAWWSDFLLVLKGLIPSLIVCGGFLAVVAGITSIRDEIANKAALENAAEKKERSAVK